MKKFITIILSVFLLSSFLSNFAFSFDAVRENEETYFQYTISGKTLWCVRDLSNGDYDPGYRDEQKALKRSIDLNGYAKKGPDRQF